MNLIDLKYAGILSTRIERYVVKSHSPYRANMRCPICGDSKKSKRKTRGWILEKDNVALYYCHNCGASLPMRKFLEQIDPPLAKDYVVDMAMENKYARKEPEKPLEKLVQKQPKFTKFGSALRKIRKISQLPAGHGARDYVLRRKIPSKEHYRLYYVPKFVTWVNSLIPGKMKMPEKDKPRLILPFLDKSGNLFGFQGRSFDPKDELRYITIMLDENMPKIFGLDLVDFTKRYYVVEGPIDALFLDNTVAMAGADGNANGLDHLSNAVFVFDLEPRNKEIVKRMERCIEKGYKVCIWPPHMEDRGKDINDFIMSGLKAAEIQLIIDQNTYQGLQAQLLLMSWRKC